MSTALHWFKSSYSSNEGGNTGPNLTVAPGTWTAFLTLTQRDRLV